MLLVDALLTRLAVAYGPQNWWPADSPFEVMVGAILVQRTSWQNAERAVARLKRECLVTPRALVSVDRDALAELIRPAGFYRTKSTYLKDIAAHVENRGGIDGLQSLPDAVLRQGLIELRGIGPETADAILLYAFGRPAWVADAYSRRLFTRMLDRPWDPATELALVRPLIEMKAVSALNELHALIVEHGKRYCRAKPRCQDCTLQRQCAFGLSELRDARDAS